MSEHFRMKVSDVFTFADGTIVLIGAVIEGPKFIHAGRCNLSIAGRELGSIAVVGERMNGGTHPEIRSVSTSQPLPCTIAELKNQEAVFAYQDAA